MKETTPRPSPSSAALLHFTPLLRAGFYEQDGDRLFLPSQSDTTVDRSKGGAAES